MPSMAVDIAPSAVVESPSVTLASGVGACAGIGAGAATNVGVGVGTDVFDSVFAVVAPPLDDLLPNELNLKGKHLDIDSTPANTNLKSKFNFIKNSVMSWELRLFVSEAGSVPLFKTKRIKFLVTMPCNPSPSIWALIFAIVVDDASEYPWLSQTVVVSARLILFGSPSR